jgi:hypothetical protein
VRGLPDRQPGAVAAGGVVAHDHGPSLASSPGR